MIPRQYGENTTYECRAESHEKVNKQKRRNDILFVLHNSTKPMTSWEIVEDLYFLGKVDRVDRNYVSPRLTEMCEDGTIEPVGKKLCNVSGRNVTAFQIRRV